MRGANRFAGDPCGDFHVIRWTLLSKAEPVRAPRSDGELDQHSEGHHDDEGGNHWLWPTRRVCRMNACTTMERRYYLPIRRQRADTATKGSSLRQYLQIRENCLSLFDRLLRDPCGSPFGCVVKFRCLGRGPIGRTLHC